MNDRPRIDLQLSRRALLANGGRAAFALSAAGGLAGLISACGGDDDEESAGASATPGAPGLTAEEIAAATGTVRALVWQGYDDKAIYKNLDGIKLDPGYLTQNEDVLTKLRVGDRAQFDTTTIFQGYIDPLLALEAIEPIDPALLTNFSGLFTRFQEEEALRRDGQLYSAPFLWGTMQVNYRADQTDAPKSARRSDGPVAQGEDRARRRPLLLDHPVRPLRRCEGPNKLTPEELDATMELLHKFKPQVAAIQPGSELTGLLVRGEVAVSTPDWAPSVIQARGQGLDVESTMPALTFIDGWLMVRGTENAAADYKLIDAAISKEDQLKAADLLGLGVVNEAAADALPEDVRSAWPYDDVDSMLTEAPAYSGVPVESDEFATLQDWVKAWERYKASSPRRRARRPVAALAPALRLEGVARHYGDVTALHPCDLGIRAGEFVTLLGPSGCGKTTLLRIVAGLTEPSAGRLWLDDVDVTRDPPERRNVNLVFQNYALFPHLDVTDNVAYGLRAAGVAREELGPRVREALAAMGLTDLSRRRVGELSGGQSQRVALARALVNRPSVLLLDEPLSALDLQLRKQMQLELRRIHRSFRTTFVYVTHDQAEALTMSDRIVVMDRGRIEQVGRPRGDLRRPPHRLRRPLRRRKLLPPRPPRAD